MNTIKQKFSPVQQEIFRLMCMLAGEKPNQSEIAEHLSVSSTAVAKSLPSLEKAGLISVNRSKKMNLVTIELNRDNARSIALKRVENLRSIYESGLVETLEDVCPGRTIVLFGSYSRGEDTKDSDIDIAVLGKRLSVDISSMEKILLRQINIQFLSLKDISSDLKSSVCNGIILSGAIVL